MWIAYVQTLTEVKTIAITSQYTTALALSRLVKTAMECAGVMRLGDKMPDPRERLETVDPILQTKSKRRRAHAYLVASSLRRRRRLDFFD